MKTNKNIIKQLARLGVFNTEPVKYEKEDDIVITNYEGVKQRVVLDDISDEDIPLIVEVEKLSTLKSIKGMVKAFYVSALVAAGIWLLSFLIELGGNL